MNLKFIRLAFSIASSLLLVSCASGYSSFYTPATGATPDAIASYRAAPPPAMPLLERSSPGDPEAILAAYAKRGYVMIGHSMFNSGTNESESSALKQGKSVGADLVLVLNPQYTGSISSSIPLTTPTTTTSYTTGTATAYGSGGTVNAYGNSTTTTHGSKTTYIPMTVHRSDYGAVYFIKQRFNFGAFVRDLNDAERQALETNQGVVVLTIVDDTPAFRADILPGDVIIAFDGARVPNQDGFGKMTEERKGKLVTVALVRNGQRLEKAVQVNN
ncbi:PDZ domain-containing protein [Luteimonas sp. MC1825]|uniref:PDZ domain-containing protein n=1 Tax=Luteimonas sp. MC1825 TaxID=2761107 RepID=UPI001612BF8F|nr:PDZ domain-containing protein [Luteimonas sp. MC1825]MBB6598235.1 PDZ domain-containing protein [Luteimonas sp. MC1825]QOC88453.1 PDZ domain-containing protein [Luteimonas sp. MC1825]